MKIIFFALFASLFTLHADAQSYPKPAPASPPVLAPFGDGDYWVLALPLNYRIWKTNDVIQIPKGFVTDLASV
ncbi:MAG TPA: hypothetical protein VGO51_08665, partial [Burkholderiaceae bacterium]|nr:hypothetical protein [Burkholderiaceae bacterium]